MFGMIVLRLVHISSIHFRSACVKRLVKKTNHSLRATGASALFNAGLPEKLIRGVTGHRSKALQLYERPTTEQLQETSAVLVRGKKQFCPGKENMPAAATQGPSVATPALLWHLYLMVLDLVYLAQWCYKYNCEHIFYQSHPIC